MGKESSNPIQPDAAGQSADTRLGTDKHPQLQRLVHLGAVLTPISRFAAKLGLRGSPTPPNPHTSIDAEASSKSPTADDIFQKIFAKNLDLHQDASRFFYPIPITIDNSGPQPSRTGLFLYRFSQIRDPFYLSVNSDGTSIAKSNGHDSFTPQTGSEFPSGSFDTYIEVKNPNGQRKWIRIDPTGRLQYRKDDTDEIVETQFNGNVSLQIDSPFYADSDLCDQNYQVANVVLVEQSQSGQSPYIDTPLSLPNFPAPKPLLEKSPPSNQKSLESEDIIDAVVVKLTESDGSQIYRPAEKIQLPQGDDTKRFNIVLDPYKGPVLMVAEKGKPTIHGKAGMTTYIHTQEDNGDERWVRIEPTGTITILRHGQVETSDPSRRFSSTAQNMVLDGQLVLSVSPVSSPESQFQAKYHNFSQDTMSIPGKIKQVIQVDEQSTISEPKGGRKRRKLDKEALPIPSFAQSTTSDAQPLTDSVGYWQREIKNNNADPVMTNFLVGRITDRRAYIKSDLYRDVKDHMNHLQENFNNFDQSSGTITVQVQSFEGTATAQLTVTLTEYLLANLMYQPRDDNRVGLIGLFTKNQDGSHSLGRYTISMGHALENIQHCAKLLGISDATLYAMAKELQQDGEFPMDHYPNIERYTIPAYSPINSV